MKRFPSQLFFYFSLFLLLGGCDNEDADTTIELSPLKALNSFSFKQEKNPSLNNNYTATINTANHTVTLTLPAGIDPSDLIATFTHSEKSTVQIGQQIQASDISKNDFSTPVTYTVIAEDGSTEDYIVTVTIHIPQFIETNEEAAQRTKIKSIYDELMAFYDGNANNVISGANNQFSTIPGFTENSNGNRTYTLGVYKPEFKDYMLKWWRFFKAVAQRPDPYYNAAENERAEKAAFVLSSLNQITHYPPRPQDMDDAIYNPGRTGAERSNLFAANSLYWFHESVQFNFTEGKVKDNLGSEVSIPNINYMGHRWNGLWKRAASAGIGYNFFNNYTTAAYYVVYNNNEDSGFQNFSAFPHGYFPVQAQLKVKRTRSAADLFDKRYPEGFASDNTFGSDFHTIWTIQQFSDYTFNVNKPITITIRDIDETGKILDEITCNVDDEVKNNNGSFLRIKQTAFAGGWTFTFKPKDGILTDAVKDVLNNNSKRVFHITLSGEGLQPKENIADTFTYRIIYYDLDY